MSATLHLEIEVSPAHGHGFPLEALGLPTGVPAPDSLVIPVARLYGEDAVDTATLLSGGDTAYIGIDALDEYTLDDEDHTLPDAGLAALREVIKTYYLLTEAGWYADVRLRYDY